MYGKFGCMIVEQLCLHGHLEMSTLLLKVLAKYVNKEVHDQKENLLNDMKKLNAFFDDIKQVFIKLVDDRFLERLPELVEALSSENENLIKSQLKIPKFMQDTELNRFNIVDIKIDGRIFYLKK